MADSEPPRKRRRPALSCTQCRSRKVKCDRRAPCGPCLRARHAMPCSYTQDRIDESIHVPATPVDSVPSPADAVRVDDHVSLEQNVLDLQRKVNRLERLIEDKSQGQPQAQNSSVQGLSDRVDELERRLGNTPDNKQETSIPATLPYLSSSSDKTKLFGQTHWINVFQKMRLLHKNYPDEANGAGGKATEMNTLFKTCRNLRKTIKGRSPIEANDPFPDLLKDLPPRHVYDDMVQHFLRTLHPIYRILHVPSFEKELQQFYDKPESATTIFVLKLLLIIGIGSIFHPSQDSAVRPLVRRWVYAAQWWLTGPAERSAYHLDGVQVYCLLVLCRSAHCMRKESIWASVGTLVRFAMNQGLHRDPSHYPSLSVFQSEMRRRIWATVLELTVQSSFDAGMPPLISEEDYDTKAPLNIDDMEINENTTSISPKPRDQLTDSLIQILLLQSLPTRLKIARLANGVNNTQYETALQLGSQLAISCKEISVFFASNKSKTVIQPTEFHRRVLDTNLRRAILFLYRPFTIAAINDPRLYLSRKLSLESASVIASYSDSLKLPSPATDDYGRLSISGTGTFKGPLSLDIVLAIALEIITELEEETANQPPGIFTAPDEITQTGRMRLIQYLEHILEQMLQIIAQGRPTMKRYGILSGILAQIKSMQVGECSKEMIRETLLQSMHNATTLLKQHVDDFRILNDTTMFGDANDLTPGTGASEFDLEFLLQEWEDAGLWDFSTIEMNSFDVV